MVAAGGPDSSPEQDALPPSAGGHHRLDRHQSAKLNTTQVPIHPIKPSETHSNTSSTTPIDFGQKRSPRKYHDGCLPRTMLTSRSPALPDVLHRSPPTRTAAAGTTAAAAGPGVVATAWGRTSRLWLRRWRLERPRCPHALAGREAGTLGPGGGKQRRLTTRRAALHWTRGQCPKGEIYDASLYDAVHLYARSVGRAHQESGGPTGRPTRRLFEGVGGRLIELYYSFGDADGVLLFEVPDHVSATAVVLTAIGTGHITAVKTTALVTVEETLQALRKAGELSYQAPSPSLTVRTQRRTSDRGTSWRTMGQLRRGPSSAPESGGRGVTPAAALRLDPASRTMGLAQGGLSSPEPTAAVDWPTPRPPFCVLAPGKGR